MVKVERSKSCNDVDKAIVINTVEEPRSNNVYRCSNHLSLYEYTCAVYSRALQLAHGAEPTVDLDVIGTYDPILIAKHELLLKTVPFKSIRTLPNGTVIELDLRDAILPE